MDDQIQFAKTNLYVETIFGRRCNIKSINDKNFSLIATCIYLLYPYFFGHAQVNAKDIPFLSFWIVCSYYLFTIVF